MFFWAVVTSLITIALLILILPLIRKKPLVVSDVEQRNILIAREKLKELKRQFEDGELSKQQYDEQFQELELSLKNDLESIERQQTVTQGRWVIGVLLILIPAASLMLYFDLGDPGAITKQVKQQQWIQQQQQAEANIQKMVEGLAHRLQQNPNDTEGWLMLGRSYLYLKRYQAAAEAFAQAARLQPDNAEVLLQYADTLAATTGGKLTGKPRQLIDRALQLEPDNQTALWLSGLAKVEAGQLHQALKDWQKLAALVDKQSQSYSKLVGLIQALQEKTKSKPSAAEQKALRNVSIKVQVALAEALKSQVKADDTVFIYARAVNGPKMPLAIVRKQVKALPLSVTLDDTMAMMPTMSLSSVKQVEVIARVSKHGSAMPQAGDLIGKVLLKELKNKQSVTITIDQKLP
jgi:cytochrome c-type biogenesis protein CcmH